MIKNLTGGAAINYGPTLPAADATFDGSLFYKTSGADQGMHVFGFTQDGNTVVIGDQVTQSWTQVQSPGLYVSKSGDLINGALAIVGGNSTNDPYGRMSVTLPSDTNNYGFFGLTRQGQVGWSIGVDTSNRMFFGFGGAGTLTNVPTRVITFDATSIGINGNAVWHAGNDGVGSGLDAGLLAGQAPSFYTNAGNISSGTLDQARLPFVPVQQGGGTGQATSKVYIGWGGSQLLLQVDATNFGAVWPLSVSGSAATANFANTATNATNATDAVSARYLRQGGLAGGTNMIFNWAGQSAQPTWLWGGNDGTNMYVYNPSTFSVSYANTAGSAGTATNATNANYATSAGTASYANSAGSVGAVAWTSVTGRPTALSQFTNDLPPTSGAYIGSVVNLDQTSSEGVRRFHFTSNGATLYSTGNTIHDFQGSIIATGNVTAFSDRRLKTKIETITDALSKVQQLNGVTFTRISDDTRGTGLIAQDVQAVLPEAVMGSEDSMMSVAYGNLVGLLVESIKELNGQVQTMKAEIKALKDGGQ